MGVTGKELKLATVSREFFRFIRDNSIVPGLANFDTNPVPAGENWQITRAIFSDQNIGDNKSGGFKLEWGASGTFQTITACFQTGDTIDLPINRQFEGDGTNFFRLTRFNFSSQNKFMTVIIEGFKRITS